MSKKYFIMNNRENPHDGYKEVSKEFFDNYIKDSFKDKRAYYIKLYNANLETTEKRFRSFCSEGRHKKHVYNESKRAGVVSLNAIISNELDGTSTIVDPSGPLDERMERQLLIEKIPEAISILTSEERELINKIFYEGISENALSGVYGVSQSTINRRKKKILLKLKNFFEK